MRLFLLSKEHIPLAVAEAERLYGCKASRLLDNLLFLDVEALKENLAFTREIHEVLWQGSDFEEAFRNIPWEEHIDGSFLLRVHEIEGEASLAGIIWRRLEEVGKSPQVDLEKPDTAVHLFTHDNEAFITILHWQNKERFFERRSHLRAKNHPSSLNPKLARAMINLTGDAKSILDPFCGAGGILIEGALLKKKMCGIDIDARQIARAKENLATLKLDAALEEGDARKIDTVVDAIVTDLPYGKSTRLEDEKLLLLDFFLAASKTTSTIVVGGNTSLEEFFTSHWKCIASFSWYLHASMEKRIFLLEKK